MRDRRANNLRRSSTQDVKKRSKGSWRLYELFGLFLTTVGLVSLMGTMGFNVGFVGMTLAKIFQYGFGMGATIFLFFMIFTGVNLIFNHNGLKFSTRFFGIVSTFIMLLILWHDWRTVAGEEILPSGLEFGGGLFSGVVLFFLRDFFGVDGSRIILVALLLVSIVILTKSSISEGYKKTKDKAVTVVEKFSTTVTEPSLNIPNVSPNVVGQSTTELYDQENDSMFNNAVALTSLQKQSSNILNNYEDDNYTANIKQPEYDKISNYSKDIPIVTFDNTSIVNKNTSDAHDNTDDDINFDIDIDNNSMVSYEYLNDVNVNNITASNGNIILDENHDYHINIVAEANIVSSNIEELYEQLNNMSSKVLDITNVVDTGYIIPQIDNILLKNSKIKNNNINEEIKENSKILQQTLDNFKIKAKITSVVHGPAVTRYEIEPAPGVKVSKITNLADDIALNLAASSVRIEPVPSKAAIGIEVPNKSLDGVRLRDVLECDDFQRALSKLTVGLGIDISGTPVLADLGTMPHLLVAGSTGSGKSVCINTLITSILFKATPDEVKLILIDPKMVELSNYNGIPHLMVPVVTDPQKAASVLNWAVQEMEKRYALFARQNVRSIQSFNDRYIDEKLPYIVIVIDELADLMMVASNDVETAIARLAQKARAAGIHMVLATQRPSVDVITGMIKANIPSRISFAVSSQIDSRTILDRSGAEKLLGKGDMLFYPIGVSKPQRLQGAFISDKEVERLIEFIIAQGKDTEPNEDILSFTDNVQSNVNEPEKQSYVDPLLREAVYWVIDTGKASTSVIQRRFRIGYSRAARLIDTMEDLHIIGGSLGGNKPREVLISLDQSNEILDRITKTGG